MNPNWLAKYRPHCESPKLHITVQDITDCENRVRKTKITVAEVEAALHEAGMEAT